MENVKEKTIPGKEKNKLSYNQMRRYKNSSFIRYVNPVTKINRLEDIFVVVITCLGGQFGINCLIAFLKILKFQNFQKSQGWFIPKIAQTRLLVKQTKPTNTLNILKLTSFNSRQLQISQWALQNNSANNAI